MPADVVAGNLADRLRKASGPLQRGLRDYGH